MKQTKKTDLARLENMLKAAIPEHSRVNFLLSYTNQRVSSMEALNSYEAADMLDSLLKMVKLANAAQIQKLQCLYRELKIVEQKKEILLNWTKGRTDSTAGLTMDEARDLIQSLAQHEPTERLRKMIFSFGYRCGLLYGESPEDKQINRAKLNMFLRERGAVKKDIEKQTLEELKKTMGQFAAMRNNNEKNANNKDAKKVTNELLNELNLSVK
jgi:hypothetical protein